MPHDKGCGLNLVGLSNNAACSAMGRTFTSSGNLLQMQMFTPTSHQLISNSVGQGPTMGFNKPSEYSDAC